MKRLGFFHQTLRGQVALSGGGGIWPTAALHAGCPLSLLAGGQEPWEGARELLTWLRQGCAPPSLLCP